MEAVLKKQTAFRLSVDLLDRLKVAAKKENRSLNNYVESVLMSIVYNEPNEATTKAIEEAKRDINIKDVDMTSFESFIKSCSE